MRTLFAIACADFRERSRQTRYLITIGGLAILASYFVPPPSAGYTVVQYNGARGLLTSAYVGLSAAILTTLVLSLAGFFLVGGAVRRDRTTGVGQIIAATPLAKPAYLLGKLFSNSLYLTSFAAIMTIVACILHVFRGEGPFDLWNILYPFLLLCVPTIAIISASALVTEVLKLNGCISACLWYAVWNSALVVGIIGVTMLDYTGLALSIREVALVLTGSADLFAQQGTTGLSIGVSPVDPSTAPFVWPGLRFGVDLLLERFVWLGIAVGLTLVVTPLFDRFDSSRGTDRGFQTKPKQAALSLEKRGHLPPHSTLPRLTPAIRAPRLLGIVRAELKLIVRQHRWFLPVCILNVFLAFAYPPAASVLALLIPIPILADLSTHEAVNGVEELIFSAPGAREKRVLRKGLAALVIIASAGGIVAFVRFPVAGASLIAGLLLTLAWSLVAGLVSSTTRLFLASMLFFWYLACFNDVPPALDYGGIHLVAPAWEIVFGYLGLSGVLLGLAHWWSQRRT